jgi:hypothetical protein
VSAQRSPQAGVVHVVIADRMAARVFDAASISVDFRNPRHGDDRSSIAVTLIARYRRLRGPATCADGANITPAGWVE